MRRLVNTLVVLVGVPFTSPKFHSPKISLPQTFGVKCKARDVAWWRAVSQENLRKAWESSHRCTKEDWTEWLRRLSVELLAHSSSPALRSCHQLARVQPSMARELFSVGFVSCWLEIDDNSQRELVRSLEAALVSPSIPPEIVTALLNLAEFMEHNERPLPLDTRTLGALAEKCHAYAKVLRCDALCCAVLYMCCVTLPLLPCTLAARSCTRQRRVACSLVVFARSPAAAS